MSSSGKSYRSSDRPTLPPIRHLFGDELNRSEDDDVQPRHSNDYPQRPYPDHVMRPFPSPGRFISGSHTPLQHPPHGRERSQSSYDTRPNSTGAHLYSNRSVAAPTPHSTTGASTSFGYRYESREGYPSQSATSVTNYPPQHQDLRPYSRQDYPSHSRVPASMDIRHRDTQERHAPRPQENRQSDRRERPEEIRPDTTAPPAKYECSYCGKGFNRPSSLKIHLNSHTGEKPFICPAEGCGRSFSVLSNMRRHARVHSKAQTGDDDIVTLSRPGPSTVTPVNWHQYRRGSSASVSSSESHHSRSESSDYDSEEYDSGHLEKRTRSYH